MLVGYARVSTQDQNLDLQLSALKTVGCTNLYQDQISGTKNNRPGLQLALEVLREDDTLVVWKLDRLGRTVKGLVDLINKLHKKTFILKALPIMLIRLRHRDASFFHIMASLAQMERELVTERTKAGLAAARAQGRVGGRKRKMTKSKIESAKQLLASGTLPKDVARNLGVSIPTLYRWIPASEF